MAGLCYNDTDSERARERAQPPMTAPVQMLIAFDSRAMKDNVKLLEDTLLNRCKRAKLLGYDSHSHYKYVVSSAVTSVAGGTKTNTLSPTASGWR